MTIISYDGHSDDPKICHRDDFLGVIIYDFLQVIIYDFDKSLYNDFGESLYMTN